VKALTERGIELELTVWIADAEQGQAALRSDMLTQVLADFTAAGIEIAVLQDA
jgi:small-conductance mechanosensitive channel